MWRCRWISWIWFCVIDLSEDLLLNKGLRYLVVLQLSFRNPLLQELLLSGTHYQTPSPHWLRYHPSEAISLLHHARRRAHSIAEISVRRLAIIIQIQIQTEFSRKISPCGSGGVHQWLLRGDLPTTCTCIYAFSCLYVIGRLAIFDQNH